MIEMVVHSIGQDPAKNMVVILREREGKRALPIVVGQFEAQAIYFQLRGIALQRPMTHDLTRNILEELDVQITRVTVCDLRENIYYALVTLLANGVEQDVDARPSDAIALALRAGCPIYISEKVAEEATVDLDESELEPDNDEESRFRSIVGDLDLDDLS